MNKKDKILSDYELEKLRYPIGRFNYQQGKISLENYIDDIEKFPLKLKNEVIYLNEDQLNTRYRDGGWTVKQVVHHVADSHINAYVRLKLALTETNPEIKPYYQELWAELIDNKSDINISLQLLEALHKRWGMVLKNLSKEDVKKSYFHPESKKLVSIDEFIANYAWHCNHHLAHISELKKRMNW